jgi:hypothetical protein
MRELAGILNTDRPYMTLVVDELERRQLVVRTVHPDDRRSRVVRLTAAGEAAAGRADLILNEPPPALVGLPADDLAVLDRILADLAASTPAPPVATGRPAARRAAPDDPAPDRPPSVGHGDVERSRRSG